MSSAPANAAEAVLVAIQQAAPGLVRAFDAEHSTRFEAALEALAPNTRRAYGSALAAWGRWAALQGVHALAAPPFALRAYLQERAAAGAGLSSLRLTVAALRKLQALVGVEPSAHDQIVTDTISGLARQAAAPRQAYALTAEALAMITATACQPRVGRGGRLESSAQARRRGLVDIALCRVLSDAGLRRSEAAALVWDDMARWDDGSGRLTVGRSKTDAEARTVYLTPAAVAALGAIRPARTGRRRCSGCPRLRSPAASAPRPRWPAWGRVFPGIRAAWAWQGAWPRPARRRMRSWRRAAGRRQEWSRSTRAQKKPGVRRSGWRSDSE